VLVPQAFLINHPRMARESAEPFDRELIAHLAVGEWLEMEVIGAVRLSGGSPGDAAGVSQRRWHRGGCSEAPP
jgi:hypothetical protein